MEFINTFSSDVTDLRDALQGVWGTEIGEDYKISYLGKVIIAQGTKTLIEEKTKKEVYEWINIGTNIFLGWIKEI